MKKLLLWLVVAVLGLGATMGARAGGLIIIVNPENVNVIVGPRHPGPIGPFPPEMRFPRHAFAPMEVNYEKYDTKITDQVAVTTVDQEFYNPNSQRLEGTFVFPIPKGAQIDKFTMEIDGKQTQAELLGADKARGIYEDIVRKMRDPALMEYAGQDALKVRIFPIEPNSKKRITLTYTQVLKQDSGLVDYVLPFNAGKYSAKPIKNVSVRVNVETRRPLKSIYSPTHAVEIKRNGPNRATAGYELSDVSPDSDFQLYFAPEKDEIGLNLLTYKAADEDGYFLLLASPGVDVSAQKVLPKDVVFVLDTSGSMAGKKMDQARKALEFCVENLNDTDRFEVIRFSTEVEPLFSKLVTASKENRDKAGGFIKNLKAIGATAIDDALKQALTMETKGEEDRPCMIIFLTDGMPTIGVTDMDQILAGVKERNRQNRRVFCFGIGTDVNTHLLDRIAQDTRAVTEYVLPEEDLEVKVSRFFSKIKEPVLANPTLEFTSGIRASKYYPSPLPDIFKGEQLIMVGRYSGTGNSAAVIEGKVGKEQKKFSYDVSFGSNTEHEFIPRLWATRRVGYLLDQLRLHGENGELKDEVTELARKYGIVTPYTSFLITEDETRRGVSSAVQTMPMQPAGPGALPASRFAYSSRYGARVSGDDAVLSSRSLSDLSSANVAASGIQSGAANAYKAEALSAPAAATPAPLSSAFAGGGRGGAVPGPAIRGGLPTPGPVADRAEEQAPQSQFVGGRTFYRNAGKWIEAGVQKLPEAKRQRIEFGSTEYFDLLKKHPEAGAWLSLGGNVQFVLAGTVVEVFDKTGVE